MKASVPDWIVQEVHPYKDYTMIIRFANGEERIYNAKPLLEKPIYKALKNPSFFMLAKVDCGTIVWNDDIDIAPEHLYEYSIPLSEDNAYAENNYTPGS